VGDLTWVKESYDSIRGRISSEWHQTNGQFDLRITIPANTTATVFVPASDPKKVTESSRPASESKGVTPLRFEPGAAVYQIGSGVYHFNSLISLK
jgi:alpha-L-rhamnosidase